MDKEVIAAVTARVQQHANKTFDILNDLLLDLYDDETGKAQEEELYRLLVEAEKHLQWACRRIDEAEGIAGRKAR